MFPSAVTRSVQFNSIETYRADVHCNFRLTHSAPPCRRGGHGLAAFRSQPNCRPTRPLIVLQVSHGRDEYW